MTQRRNFRKSATLSKKTSRRLHHETLERRELLAAEIGMLGERDIQAMVSSFPSSADSAGGEADQYRSQMASAYAMDAMYSAGTTQAVAAESASPHLQMLDANGTQMAVGASFDDLDVHPHAVFAEGTPTEVVEEWERRFSGPTSENGISLQGGRWDTSASGTSQNYGDAVTLTWSIVPDGTIVAGSDGPGAASNLISFFDGIYGTGGNTVAERPWFPLIKKAYDDWSALSGITFVYEANDDGMAMSNPALGELGVRGDMRIGGATVDGDYGVLAYNFYPTSSGVGGDMVIDTADIFLANNASGESLALHNMLMHEIGHGIGLGHVTPVNQTKLLEPFVSTAFRGPQHDDILAAQSLYGDRYDDNDVPENAVDLGSIDADPIEMFDVSIDRDSDADWYSFSGSADTLVTIVVAPDGQIYDVGIDGGTIRSIDSTQLGDLRFELYGPDGTLIRSQDAGGVGRPEIISGLRLSETGAYTLGVFGRSTYGPTLGDVTESQLYSLSINRSDFSDPRLIAVAPNGSDLFDLDPADQANQNIRQTAPTELRVTFSGLNALDSATLDALEIYYSETGNFEADSDLVPIPYRGLDADGRNVTLRFAENLKDGFYQLSVSTDLTSVIGAAFVPTNPQSVPGDPSKLRDVIGFELELGGKVVAVVPQPIDNGVSRPNEIDVYFDDLDLFRGGSSVDTKSFYQLINTQGTVTTEDDVVIPVVSATRVDADRKVTLSFASDLGSYVSGGSTLRLRIGDSTDFSTVGVTQHNVANTSAADPGLTAATANTIPSAATGSWSTVVVGQEVRNTTASGLSILVDNPGGTDEPGHRDIEVEDHFLFPGARDGDNSITSMPYTFLRNTSYGTNSAGAQLFNDINADQEERFREILELYETFLGIDFYETANSGLALIVGDLSTADPTVVSGVGGVAGLGGPGRVTMDSLDFQDQASNRFGGSFFDVALHEVGHAIGLGHAYDLPPGTVQGSESEYPDTVRPGPSISEWAFPGDNDLVHALYLHQRESLDVDLYRVDVTENGMLKAQTFAQRLSDASLLDTRLSLFRQNGTELELVSSNEDYFGSDSFVEFAVTPGVYFVGVAAEGNEAYDPNSGVSSAGGASEGKYELRVDFSSDVGAAITDAGGSELDGDRDGVAGGNYNFWFKPAGANTIYVNKSAGAGSGLLGSQTNPFNNIPNALAAAQTLVNNGAQDVVVRLLPNGGSDGEISTADDNLAYEVGYIDALDQTLADGRNLVLPGGIQLVIDAGVVMKFLDSRISVGSDDDGVDRSGSSIQVQGTPELPVYFTSYNDRALGSNSNPLLTVQPASGNWGGIEIRNDIDRLQGRGDAERQGIFDNYINHAEFTFGGGEVSTINRVIDPIHLSEARAEVSYNELQFNSRGISADPNTFAVTTFSEPRYQKQSISGDGFVSGYDRVGPSIHGNILVNNATNGLFVRIDTPTGGSLEQLVVPARFDDTDIVHVLSENLLVDGSPGGLFEESTRPNPIIGLAKQAGSGALPAGNYQYSYTFVDVFGFESPGSLAQSVTGVTAGSAVKLSNISPATGKYVGRILYRSVDGGPFKRIAALDKTSRDFTDTVAAPLATAPTLDVSVARVRQGRLDASLVIDPGTIIKTQGARIQLGFGTTLLAEGKEGKEIIFTARGDDRYGAGGTFNTNGDATSIGDPGDWAGIYASPTSRLSLDHTLIAFAGGVTGVGGGTAAFNPIQIHQAEARIANSVFEDNLDGVGGTQLGARSDFAPNSAATIHVTAAQPTIVGNTFVGNSGAVIDINVNALNSELKTDLGRQTGNIDRYELPPANHGPVMRGNRMEDNDVNGMVIRGEVLTTEVVWDDTDIVHVLLSDIEIPDLHTFGGMRLQSSSTESLVVKLNDAEILATGRSLDIVDRIGGRLMVLGQPGFPVVMTSIFDDTAGAGFTPSGEVQNDTIPGGPDAQPGDWQGLRFDPYSHDRNVAVATEREGRTGGVGDLNANIGQHQELGTLAANEKSGDENIRLGFEVYGAIAADRDQDLYSFEGTAGTMVWFDIDRTDAQLDTVLELLDGNGRVLALSQDSRSESMSGQLTFVNNALMRDGHALPMQFDIDPELNATGEYRDLYSQNDGDSAMRVVLPGTSGTRNTFYVRVRSSNPAANYTTMAGIDASRLMGGTSQGGYQFQIRLSETDEFAGSVVRYADLRYATDAIVAIGLPAHSPLAGEIFNPGGTIALGSLSNTDRGAISIAGTADNTVDVYTFTVDRDSLQGVVPTTNKVSTVFDIDWADGLTRPDTTLYLFDGTSLIAMGTNSNILDDQITPIVPGQTTTEKDLSRGSFGNRDAYIGPLELNPNGNYQIVVGTTGQMPADMTQFTQINPTNTNARLEPLDPTVLIADDRFDYAPTIVSNPSEGTPVQPRGDQLTESLQVAFEDDGSNIVPWQFGDIPLLSIRERVDSNAASRLSIYNPFTGRHDAIIEEATSVPIGAVAQSGRGDIIAIRNEGNTTRTDANTGTTYRVSEDGVFTAIGATGIQTYERAFNTATPPVAINNRDDEGMRFESLAFYNSPTTQTRFLYGLANRGSFTGTIVGTDGTNDTIGGGTTVNANNLIYRLDPDTGAAVSRAGRNMTGGFESANPLDSRIQNNYTNFNFPSETPWAGTNIVAQIQIPTVSPATGGNTGNVVDLVTDINGGEFLYAFTDTGAVWRARFDEDSDNTYASGDIRGIATLIVDPTVVGAVAGTDFITDSNGNQLVLQRVSVGPENFRDVNDTVGISDLYFGVGRPLSQPSAPLRFYAFDLNDLTAQPIFSFGADSVLVDNTATSGDFAGLFFSSLDSTLWHLSDTLRTAPGHGVNALDDRQALQGGGSLRFGFDELDDDFNHLSHLDGDGDGRVSDNSDGNNDLDADDLQGFSGYNFLGGAHGSVQSNSLDLTGFSADDQPKLYFTYLLDTENTNADDNVTSFSDAGLDDVMRDSLRVMIAGDDGQWQLVATNNFDDTINNRVWDDVRGATHEYDPVGSQGYTDVFAQRFVQELFDDNVFRQARIDLGPWAGQQDVKIRFEFSTAGEARPDQSEIQALPGHKLTDGQTLTVSGNMPDRLVDVQGDSLSNLTKAFEFDLGLVVQMPSGRQVTAPLALNRPDGTTIVELVPGVGGLGQIGIATTDTAADVVAKVAAYIANDSDPGTTTVQSPGKPSWIGFNSETQTGSYTFAGLNALIHSTPGISAAVVGVDRVAIDVDISMTDIEVRDAIQFAMANEIHYMDALPSLAAFPVVGNTNAVRLYDLAVSQTVSQGIAAVTGNDTIATAQNIDGEAWTQSSNSNITQSTSRPHVTLRGLGDGSFDYYSFTVDAAGATATFDIDKTTGADLQLHLYDSAGVALAGNDDADVDTGSNTSFDPFLQHTFLAPGTYVIGVAAYPSTSDPGGITGLPVPSGQGYELHVSVDGKAVSAENKLTPLTLINGENAGASNVPGSDFGVYSGSRTVSGLLRAGERSRGLGGANGVYLDDIVIGLAERGESFTGGTQGTQLADNPYHEALRYDSFTGTVAPVREEIESGPYQLEIRLGQEYLGVDNIGKDQRFAINQRLAEALNLEVQSDGSQLIDGDTFTLSNGFESVRFEFNDITIPSLTTPVDTDNVAIEYRASDTAAEVAQSIRNAINSGSVRTALGIEVTSRSGELVDTTDAVIIVHGHAAATHDGGIDFSSTESGLTHLLGVITGQNVVLGEDNGDRNRHRDQGQFIVDSNVISFSSGTALNLSASDVAPGNKVPNEGSRPKPGAVRNLPTLNSEGLIPGAVVQNNLLINNGNGILLGGNPAMGGPAAFSRVVNNTVYNSGIGVQIENGAAPTLLNNVFVDNFIGINAVSAGPTVVRGTLYQGNLVSVLGIGAGTEAIIDPTGPLFVNPNATVFDLAGGSPNFYPAAGSPLIDSSIESQIDRSSIVSVKNSVGISQSPIVVTKRDLAGQIRKNGSTDSGQGNNVDIDRGALDRSDTTGPKAQLTSPNDNDSENIDVDPSQTFLQLTEGVYEFFEILITEGAGIGPDASTISADQIILRENGVVLVAGIDFTLGYNPATRTLRLTPMSGIWRPDSTYQIILNNQDTLSSDGTTIRAISDLAGNPLQPNRPTGETRFTIVMPEVKLDYGDAPASYGTLLSNSGARHTLNNSRSPRLGQYVDVDFDGALFPGSDDAWVPVSVSSPAGLFTIVNPAAGATTLIQLNGLPVGGEVLTIDVAGVTTRLELITGSQVPSSSNVAVPFSSTDTVEEVTTKLLSAIRTRVPAAGDSVVVSLDDVLANTLTITAVDDEDGVATGIYTAPNGTVLHVFTMPDAGPGAVAADEVLGYINPLDPAGTNLNVSVTGAGLLDAWIDFDGNGTFESTEQIFVGTPVIQGNNLLTISSSLPAYAAALDGDTWMRFRISDEGKLGPTGVAVGGEVEDHRISVRSVSLPTPFDDSFNAVEDTTLEITVGGAQGTLFDNDTGLSGQLFPVRYFLGALPQHGTIEVIDRTTGEFRYTPNDDYYGEDTFTYRLSTQENVSQQAMNLSTFATVTLNIAPVNDAPAAIDQAFVASEDTSLTITAAELLAGAAGHADPAIPTAPYDESGQTLRILSVTGGDLLTGTTIDQANASSTAITVEGGTLTATFDVDGSLVEVQYTPKLNFNSDNLPPAPGEFRLDQFLFTVEDDGVLVLPDGSIDPSAPVPLTTVATATVRVTPENDAPLLSGDTVAITNPDYIAYYTSLSLTAPVPTEDQSLVIPADFLLQNDLAGPVSAADENQSIRGNDGSISVVQPVALVDPSLGTIALDANGDVVFTPTANVYGQVLFTYTVVDQGVDEAVDGTRVANPLTSTVTSTIFLEPVNDEPVAFDRALSVSEVAEPDGPAVLTFNAADLITGKVGEQPSRGGSFLATLPAPYNESNQDLTLRVVAFATSVDSVDVDDLASGNGTVTLMTGIGGQLTLTFDLVAGAFVSGTYQPPVDYNERDPFDPNDFFTFTIADDGDTAFVSGIANRDLPDARSITAATVTLTVTQTNDPPVFETLPEVDLLERDDSLSTTIPGVIFNQAAGPETALDELAEQTVTFAIVETLSNVPPGLMLQAPRVLADGSLEVFPAPDQFGTATYVVRATDAEPGNPAFNDPRSTDKTFVVNVRPVNDAPRLNPAVLGTSDQVVPTGPNPIIDQAYSVANDGTITYTLREDNTQALGDTSQAYFIPIQRPAATAGYRQIGLLDVFTPGPANEVDPLLPGGAQTLELFDFPAKTALGGDLTGVFEAGVLIGIHYVPPINYNNAIGGDDAFTYTVRDKSQTGDETYSLAADALVPDPLTSTNQVRLNLNPVNDRPQFQINTPQLEVSEDGAKTTINNYAFNINAGPPFTAFDEIDLNSGQQVAFSVTALGFAPEQSSQFFSQFPAIDPNGQLTFRPAANVFGTFEFEVLLTDTGPGNATRGDLISSLPQTMTITVQPVNDPPQINPSVPPLEFSLLEDGDITIQIRGDSSNPGLLDVFQVGPANEAADVNPGGNQTLTLGTPIPVASTGGGTLTRVTDDLGNLIALRYKPRANFTGTDSIIYTVLDNGVTVDVGTGGTSRNTPRIAANTVAINVLPVNDPPIFSGAGDVVSVEDQDTGLGRGVVRVPNWATNVQAGPAGAIDELQGSGTIPAQPTEFVITLIDGDASLFSVAPYATIEDSKATLAYTLAPDATGTATFTAQLRDLGPNDPAIGDNPLGDTQTFTIRVTGVNDAPTFTAGGNVVVDEDSGPYNAPWASSIASGPADESGQTVVFNVTVPLASQALFATQPEINEFGVLRFTPALNAVGTATIVVTASDSGGAVSAPVSFEIQLTEVNDPPQPFSDVLNPSDEDTVLLIPTSQLLANDKDADQATDPNEVLTLVMPEDSFSVSGARVTYDEDTQTIRYDPTDSSVLQSLAPGGRLTDSFTYRLRDKAGDLSAPVVVSVNINGVNDKPEVMNDNPALEPVGSTIVRALDNDTDIDGQIAPNSLRIELQPAFGSVSVDLNGVITYTPFASFTGEDTFSYTVADNLGLRSDPAIVTINANPAPLAKSDAAGTFIDEAVVIPVSVNDSDSNGSIDKTSIRIVSAPGRGDAVPLADGSIRYIPATGFVGVDSFTYSIADNEGRYSAPATVTVQVVASRLQNPNNFSDVNGDGDVSALDALLIVNRLMLAGGNVSSIPVEPGDRGPNYYDTSGDKKISALDALQVINQLMLRGTVPGGSSGAGEMPEGEQVTNGNNVITTSIPMMTSETVAVIAEPNSPFALAPRPDMLESSGVIASSETTPNSLDDSDTDDWLDTDVVDLIAVERDSEASEEDAFSALDSVFLDF